MPGVDVWEPRYYRDANPASPPHALGRLVAKEVSFQIGRASCRERVYVLV